MRAHSITVGSNGFACRESLCAALASEISTASDAYHQKRSVCNAIRVSLSCLLHGDNRHAMVNDDQKLLCRKSCFAASQSVFDQSLHSSLRPAGVAAQLSMSAMKLQSDAVSPRHSV